MENKGIERYKEKVFYDDNTGLFAVLRKYDAYGKLGNEFWKEIVAITRKQFRQEQVVSEETLPPGEKGKEEKISKLLNQE